VSEAEIAEAPMDYRGTLKHPTLDHLHTLGLYGMAKAFADLAAADQAKDLAHASGIDPSACSRCERRSGKTSTSERSLFASCYSIAHCLASHPGEGVDLFFQCEPLGGEAPVFKGVPVAPRSPATSPVHPADARPPNRRRLTLKSRSASTWRGSATTGA
jgi:hypothetical protein